MHLVRMATHSSIPAWSVPETEEPGRLQSMGSQRVRHNWATSLLLHFFKLVKVKSLSPVTFCNLVDCVHGIFQAKVLEWVAISFSRGSSWPRDQTQVSCLVGRGFTIWATYLNWWIDGYPLGRNVQVKPERKKGIWKRRRRIFIGWLTFWFLLFSVMIKSLFLKFYFILVFLDSFYACLLL